LLDVSRVSRGAFTLHPRRVKLEAIARHALETVQPGIDVRGHAVTLAVNESIELDCDPVRIEQVLGNLLTNAAKYSAPGSGITLAANIESGFACIRVSDTGIGFESVTAHRLFEMFSQIGDPSERAEGGLGVGLALAKAIVELHHGSIEARSEGLGKGSEFVVHLPLPQAPASASASSAGMGVAGAALHGARRRVLLADDNHDGADSLAAALKLSGHEVMVAYDGYAALDAGPEFAPEIALIDIGMPGLNGYEVARAARIAPWGRSATLVALTGWGQEEDKRRALEAGFDIHLTKPVDLGLLEGLLATPPRRERASA
jgi:CheY-like chemotaxis protein